MTIKVEVFSSPGCSKCRYVKAMLKKMVKKLGDDRIEWRNVNILQELDYAVQMGVLTTPAIAVDGVLVFSGLPSEKKLRTLLEEKLEQSISEPS